MADEQPLLPQDNPNDKLSTGLQVLSFCIPLAGAIIYFSEKDKNPNKAKAACHAALFGLGLGILINIVVTMAQSGR